jgi:hypothetical protein
VTKKTRKKRKPKPEPEQRIVSALLYEKQIQILEAALDEHLAVGSRMTLSGLIRFAVSTADFTKTKKDRY